MLHALTIVFAATEGEEPSKTLFYIAGGLLVVFAVAISAIGITPRCRSYPSSFGGRGRRQSFDREIAHGH